MESRQPQAILHKTRPKWELGRPPLLVSKRDAAALLSLCLRSIDNLIAVAGRKQAWSYAFSERDRGIPQCRGKTG